MLMVYFCRAHVSNQELEQFKREQRRRPVMITVTAPNRTIKKKMIRTGTLRNGAVRGISSLRRSQRSNLGQMDDSDFEVNIKFLICTS